MPETPDAQLHAQKPAAAALQAKLNQGTALHQQGKLAEAERCYEEVLQQQSDHFNALHLLGVIAHQTRRTERAVERQTRGKPTQEQLLNHNHLAISLSLTWGDAANQEEISGVSEG